MRNAWGRHQRVVVVTGAGSGIGRATSSRLNNDGWAVAGWDLFDREGVTDLVDVTDDGSVHEAVAAVIDRHARLDAVVNVAGIGASGDLSTNTDDEWRRLFEVNVLGPVRVVRACLPRLRTAADGTVVNVSSTLAHVGAPGRVAYTATKVRCWQ